MNSRKTVSGRILITCLAILAGWSAFQTDVAFAEASGPDFFRVIGIAPSDVLNIRAEAGADHAKVGEIPPDADGMRNLGCAGGLNFAEWQNASEDERAAAMKRRWCKIDYAGVQGWVAARFLAEGSAPTARAEPSVWRIVEVRGLPVDGAPAIGFRPDGSFYGTTGCNRFQGQATVEDGLLLTHGPVASTRMACTDDRLGAQERDILAIIDGGPWIQYDPFSNAMVMFSSVEGLSMRVVKGW